LDPVIQISVSCALAVLWLAGAARKVTSFGEFGATVREYRVLPRTLALPSATLLIGLEIGLGVALLASVGRPMALIGSAGLLILYAAAIGLNLLRGRRHVDCGCTGPGLRQPLSGWLVWRNLALAAGALLILFPVKSRALLWVDAISIVATVGILAALYATLNRLMANARALPGLGH
jgi:hypothetical protein